MNDTSERPRKSNQHDEQVPAAWVSRLAALWKHVVLAEVECRRGPKGAPRGVASVTIEGKEESENIREDAQDVCQTLWDAAFQHHLDVGGTVDAAMVLYKRDDKGGMEEIAKVTTGGRMRGGETEDPEGSSGEPTLKVALAAIEKLIGLNLGTIERANALLVSMQPFAHEAARVRAAEVQAEADGYKADKAAEIVRSFLDRVGPAVDRYAESKFQSTVSGRVRPPTGDTVIDAWRDVVESVDMPTHRRIVDAFGDDARLLIEALANGDTMGRDDVIRVWKQVRAIPAFAANWREFLAVIPDRARLALPRLADAVRAASPD